MRVLLVVLVQGFALSESFRDPTPRSLHPGSRIVGGVETDIRQFPWQLSLQRGTLGIFWSHICGAVLIGETTALTAAHCVDTSASLRVRAGSSDWGNSGETISVQRVITHEDWDTNGAGYPNDIAVLILSRAANVNNDNIAVIDLAKDNLFAGDTCTISGWGYTTGGGNSLNRTLAAFQNITALPFIQGDNVTLTEFDKTNQLIKGSTPAKLQSVDMDVLTNTECGTRWSGVQGADINDGHICVFQDNKSACSGDSGGPMTCYKDGTPYLAGVTSWGMSTCEGAFPSVYTRVSHYYDWIRSKF